MIRFIDRWFPPGSASARRSPGGRGLALGGGLPALSRASSGAAWWIFLLHHVTFAINSLCHFMGRSRFETGDHSRNLFWLAPISFGEAWHNNHHASRSRPSMACDGARSIRGMGDPRAREDATCLEREAGERRASDREGADDPGGAAGAAATVD